MKKYKKGQITFTWWFGNNYFCTWFLIAFASFSFLFSNFKHGKWISFLVHNQNLRKENNTVVGISSHYTISFKSNLGFYGTLFFFKHLYEKNEGYFSDIFVFVRKELAFTVQLLIRKKQQRKKYKKGENVISW